MENPEELLHSLEEFSKIRPRDIPRDLEEYLCFVAKTGDPIYQWPTIKTLFREKLINVINEFYESCASMDIPACPNVEIFNYETMKTFILEKLDTFVSAPFTVQRICELLTTPRKEYSRIDKYMRALEKNILVVSTMEPGRTGAKNGDSVVNGVDSDHTPETSHCNDINVEEMDDNPSWRNGNAAGDVGDAISFTTAEKQVKDEEMDTEIKKESEEMDTESKESGEIDTETKASEETPTEETPASKIEVEEKVFVSIEPVVDMDKTDEVDTETSSTITITPVPAEVQTRRISVETEVTSETADEPLPASDNEPAPAEAEAAPVEAAKVEIPETNEAEKTQESAEDEALIILATEPGIENISPESSTSSPDTLQNESREATTISEPSQTTPAEPKTDNEDVSPVVDSSNSEESQEPKEPEVSSSVVEETSSEAEATSIEPEIEPEDIPAEIVLPLIPVPEASVGEPHLEPDSERADTPMDVDSSSDKEAVSEEVSIQ